MIKRKLLIIPLVTLLITLLALILFVIFQRPENTEVENLESNIVEDTTVEKEQGYHLNETEKEILASNQIDTTNMKDSEIIQTIYGDKKYTKYENMTKYNESGLPEFDLSQLDTLYNKYFSLYKFGRYEEIIKDFEDLKTKYSFTNLEEHKLLTLIDDTNFALKGDLTNFDEMLRFMNNHKNPDTLLWDFHLVNPKVMNEIIFDNLSAIPLYSDMEILNKEEFWPFDNEDLYEEKKGFDAGAAYLYEITYKANTEEVFVARIGVMSNGSCFMIDNYPITTDGEYLSIRYYVEPY